MSTPWRSGPRTLRGRFLRGGLWPTLIVLVGACSGQGHPVTSGAEPNLTTAPSTVVRATTAPEKAPPPMVVRVTSTVGTAAVSDEVVLGAKTTADPFGRFATCSGLWDSFGAYNVLISNPDPEIGSVQINTVDNLRRPSATRATARVERGSKLYISNGILDFDSDFRRGIFGGKTDADQDVRIEFECDAERQPEPIDRTRQFVDVAALLKFEGRERIVSTGVTQGCDDDKINVKANPDHPYANGAISSIRITPDDLAISIGRRKLKFVDQSVTPRDARSGTFRAETEDGVTVTGAYFCRQ